MKQQILDSYELNKREKFGEKNIQTFMKIALFVLGVLFWRTL